jgi:uncharacterized protein
VTHRIALDPFTLAECAAFFQHRGAAFSQYQLLQLYMVTGGIPFYLDQVDKGFTVVQNIDRLCFSKNGLLRTEFDNLCASLFKKSEVYVRVIETLAEKSGGMTRDALATKSQISKGGNLSGILHELEQSGFIRRYKTFGNTTRDTLYQVSDFYSLFYLKFIKNADLLDNNSWINRMDHPDVRAWSGYAFEQVCLSHLSQIKHALGISGVMTISSAWRGSDGHSQAQIDLLIDRRDQTINVCEMKFSVAPFSIDKEYAEALRRKVGVFKTATATRKAIFLTFITTFGLVPNQYAGELVQKSLTMDVLFT